MKNFAHKITPWKVLVTVLGVALFAVVLMGVSRYYITEAIEERHQQAFSAMQTASEQGRHQQVIEFSSIVDRDKLTHEQIYTYDAAFAKALGSTGSRQESLSIFQRLAEEYILEVSDAIHAGQIAEEADNKASALYFYQLAMDINKGKQEPDGEQAQFVRAKIKTLKQESQE